MQNSKILEMLDKGQTEELKSLLQDEIYANSLKSNPSAKKRYAAMKVRRDRFSLSHVK